MRTFRLAIALCLALGQAQAGDLTGTIGGGSGGGSGVTSISAGCQATPPGPSTGAVAISTQFLESANSAGASGAYTIQASDGCTDFVAISGVTSLVLPVATTSGFTVGKYYTITNESGITLPLSVTTSTLGTYTAVNLGVGATIAFQSDGTNYHFTSGSGAVSFKTGSSTGNTLPPIAGMFVCTSTCTVTPPVPLPGYQFCVMNDDNVSTVITLGAIGSSARYENTARTAYGTAGTGTLTSGGAAADMICIVGRDSTHYLSPTFVGTWTAS